VRHREDVGEQDRRIEIETPERLQRDFAGQFRIAAQAHEVARLLTQLAVLGQIAAGLPHDPYRCARHRLAQQRAYQEIVSERRGHWCAVS
jgi:hypothetical protein